MLTRLRSRRRDDAGTSLVEVVVAATIGALALAAVYSVMWGFTDDVAVATDLANAQRDTRPVMQEIVIELRQAMPASSSAGGDPVEVLSTTSITFHSDRWDATGPERITYTLESCASGLCDLRRTVLSADTSSVSPDWTYDDGDVVVDFVVAEGVVDPATSGEALFAGVEYVSGSPVVTSTCDAPGGTACDFPLVAVDLKIDPNGLRDNPRVYEIYEEVRMRNAS
ncbi:MAG: hypothetical protein AAFZ07_17840 [Actinomycetota bacterium]